MHRMTIICVLFLFQFSSAKSIHPFQTWMNDFPSSGSYSLYNKTIFDILLPGTRSSGMIDGQISNIPSNATSNVFNYSRISSLSAQHQILWSARQGVSILNQLRSGARFIDLQIEAAGDNYYAYNGLLGADINSIIDDIYTFTDSNYGPHEIIIVYLSNFHGSNAELQGLYDIFTSSDLHSKMLNNSQDLSTKTLQSILNDGKNIIAISDDLTSINPPNTFFDASAYLHIESSSAFNLTLGYLEEIHEVRTFVTSNTRGGWPSNTLNLIYWTRDIAPNAYADYYSFRQYNIPLAHELKDTIATYPKLRFENVLLVDFISSSDVVEQSIILNYEYLECNDLIWNNEHTGCPFETSLKTYWKYDSLSAACDTPNSAANLGTNCKRSCGLCPVFTNIPGSNCSKSSDCNSPLYEAYGSRDSGECFMSEASFCLGLSPYDACDNYAVSNICENATYYIESVVSECGNYCSSDYQCLDGYCNIDWSICMTFNETKTTTTTSDATNAQKYNLFESELAQEYRSYIDVLRPGDSEADYPEDGSITCTDYTLSCFIENLDADSYVTSILGLILMIVILSILLCVCGCICCPFWCCCDRACKKCCCAPCFGKTKDRFHCAPCACICLSAVIASVCLFALDGIVANTALHRDIFDDANYDSLVSASNRLFDDMEDKFGSVSNATDFILDNVENILNTVDDIIGDNATTDVKDGINDMYNMLGMMSSNYSNGITLRGFVMNPFKESYENWTLDCIYCDIIHDTIISVNDTLTSESNEALDDITSILDTTSDLVDETDDIINTTHRFQNSVDEILHIINDTQMQYNGYMDTAETYEATTYITALFAMMFMFLIFPVCGIVLKSKWCFKINCCLAMFCCVLLLLISVPFVFMITLSGDFCVRLDEFEDALPTMESRLGRDIFNDSVFDIDNSHNTNNAKDTLDLIDTCFDGGSILDVFNLSAMLDWYQYRQEMLAALNMDRGQYYSFAIPELETAQSETASLSVDEFTAVVDEFILSANVISGCQCIDTGVEFNRSNLNPGTQCTASVDYWSNISWPQRSECKQAFKNASYAVQTENQKLNEGKQKIVVLKENTQKVFQSYQSIRDAAYELVQSLQDIYCLADPLFAEFDEILNRFTNCGFVGVLYGDFKRIGCITIFDDVYVLGRSIIGIAFLCLLIALFSSCLDYVYAPIKKDVYLYSDEQKEPKQDVEDINVFDIEVFDIELESHSANKMTPTTPASLEFHIISPTTNLDEPPDGLTIPEEMAFDTCIDVGFDTCIQSALTDGEMADTAKSDQSYED